MPLSPQITITPVDIATKNFDISAVTYTSTTATYTATGHTFAIGDTVLVSDLLPDGYNGTFTVTAIATNTFTVANTTNTAVTDAVGNAFWVDPTEYSYENVGEVYFADSDDLATITSALSTVENAVNGKNKIYRQATAPSGTLVTGDVWFDTSNGNRQYYWSGTAWTDVQDTAIAAAAAAATAAQTTANGKNKIYRQGTSPGTTGNAIGDTWFNTASDNAISRWDGTSWVATSLGNGALASISASKITAGTIDASVITVSNLDAGNISTGTLAAARIATGSLDASKITAGTITASQIATGTITATQIAAGTITAANLASGTITADRISVGAIGGFTITSTYLGGSGGFTLYSNGTIDGGSANTIFYGKGNFGGGTAGSETLIITGASNFNGAITGLAITANGELYAAGHGTTANAANGYVFTTGGRIARSTASSARYKENIVDLKDVPELDPQKLLNFKVRAFSYKQDYLKNDDRAGVLIPGLIAEEVDAIYPLCADYADGQVENINDRAILINLLALVQLQDARIKALEGN